MMERSIICLGSLEIHMDEGSGTLTENNSWEPWVNGPHSVHLLNELYWTHYTVRNLKNFTKQEEKQKETWLVT